MFCKSDDESLEESIEEPFHYNRFGAKNGFIFMIFRFYFDFSNDTIGSINGLTIKQSSSLEKLIAKVYPDKTIGSQTCVVM